MKSGLRQPGKFQPFAGCRCAMVLINNQLIELIETTLSESEIWGDGVFRDSILYPRENKNPILF
ncbi:hypothetical protein EQM14_14095 [Caproiciproducens sp. NJN-50]|uniref:hypothetical protein n=1 Tax=Acutalibacteraceae TaxID=3082771 RepID=UPI000FFE1492|nr:MULTISPECIES: hypothetical protein [Acutalibacteraceae]QAT50805.1 hypothetical protein EQM14_14095 [Caproiciproducens sp. NJN-50]